MMNQKINQVIGMEENDRILGVSYCPHYSEEMIQRIGKIQLRRIRNLEKHRIEGKYSIKKQNYRKCIRIVGKEGT